MPSLTTWHAAGGGAASAALALPPLAEDAYGPFSGQVTGAARQALRRAVLEAEPRLVEPLFLCEVCAGGGWVGGRVGAVNSERVLDSHLHLQHVYSAGFASTPPLDTCLCSPTPPSPSPHPLAPSCRSPPAPRACRPCTRCWGGAAPASSARRCARAPTSSPCTRTCRPRRRSALRTSCGAAPRAPPPPR